MINFEYLLLPDSELLTLEKFDQTFAINQLDWQNTLAISFLLRIRAKGACGEKNPLISSPHGGVTKVTNLCPADAAANTFTLKHDFQTNKRVEPQNTTPVNATIVAFAKHNKSFQAIFMEQPFTKSFKTIGWE